MDTVAINSLVSWWLYYDNLISSKSNYSSHQNLSLWKCDDFHIYKGCFEGLDGSICELEGLDRCACLYTGLNIL